MATNPKGSWKRNGLVSLLLAVAAIVVSSERAEAQIVFDPAITYTQTKITDDVAGVSTDDKALTADLKLSYLFTAQSIFVGAMYKHEDSTLTGGDVKGYAIGPTVGWTTGGWTIAGTYQFLGERRFKTGAGEVKYKDPRGFQVDVAYTHMLTPDFGFGPQLTYRDVTFDKADLPGGGSSSADRKEQTLTPYIAFHFQF